MEKINNSWAPILHSEVNKLYFKKMWSFVVNEYKQKKVYPAFDKIFNAFRLTEFDNIKIVILGQDPYHQPNQAMGLSFSVPQGINLPPSLKNIYAELKADLNIDKTVNGDLTKWAEQGVLLLNTVLTVEEGKPNSHKNIGWLDFTKYVISSLNNKKNVVYILWGANAISYENMIDKNNNYIIKSVHPSPLSAYNGFFGSKPFSKANNYLIKNGISPINW